MDLIKIKLLVAERVMGWQWREMIGTAPDRKRSMWLFNPDGRIQDIPDYPNDIAAAWQVVEHMRNNVPDFRALRMESVPLGYMVAFYSHKNPLDRIGAFVAAKTAPLAICLAALKAMGVDYEE